jgi:glycosyltransferase involved in cell wall biosynthesis
VSEFAPSTRLRNVPDGVSIVIPNWNHEYLLGRSVGSALRAVADLRGRGVPGEVLVIDDGSRDGSITLLRQLEALYFEDGLRVRLRGANSGLPAIPRNEGLRDALYRYVCYLDADDELIPENLYQFHRAIRATGAALVYGNMVGLAENPDANMLISNESYQQRMLSTNYIGAMSVMDRMQISDVGGNLESPTMVAREDWELHLHLAANGKLLIITTSPAASRRKRTRAKSISGSKPTSGASIINSASGGNNRSAPATCAITRTSGICEKKQS